MLPAYIDPVAPGFAEAWRGALAGGLGWLAAGALLGTFAVAVLVAWEAAPRRRRTSARTASIHGVRRALARP